jgi:hypothetical protein
MMARSDAARMDSIEKKLDDLIRLSHARDTQIQDLSEQVSRMAPTVQQVADAVTFAKIGRSMFRVLVGTGVVMAPIIWFVQEKWHILVQLFRRAA